MRRVTRAVALAAGAWLLACGPVSAARRVPARPSTPPAIAGNVTAGVTLRPVHVHLGERTTVDGRVIVDPGVAVRWSPPSSDSVFTWSELRAWRSTRYAGVVGHPPTADTVHVRVSLQAFETGVHSVPPIRFQVVDRSGNRRVSQLPLVQLVVEPVIAANDTAAQLRPLRGPLAAPWWERVPWRWVLIALGALAAAIALWRWLARRTRRPAPAVGPAFTPALDPIARALAELESLRGLHLPEQERYGEHAFHLTRIARQFLESVAGTGRGDTTPELIARLPGTGVANDDRDTLAGLLKSWDLLKFARVGSSREEARRAEDLLESFVKRWGAVRAAASRVA